MPKFLLFTTFIPRDLNYTFFRDIVGVIEIDDKFCEMIIKGDKVALALKILTDYSGSFNDIRFNFPIDYWDGLGHMIDDGQIAIIHIDPTPHGTFLTTNSSTLVFTGNGYVQFRATTAREDLEFISKSSIKIKDIVKRKG